MRRFRFFGQSAAPIPAFALLFQQDHYWRALLPLTAPEGVGLNASRIRAALSATGLPNVLLVDMKAESDHLYSGYLHEAIRLSLGGLVAIIGLLVVVAVGSNYVLFFDRADHPFPPGEGIMTDPKTIGHTISPSTLASMLFASLTTVAGFGLLAFSNLSILRAMGVTVAPGVILALIYSAIFARQPNA